MFMSEGYNGQVKILLDLHPESNNAIPKMAFIPICKPLSRDASKENVTLHAWMPQIKMLLYNLP